MSAAPVRPSTPYINAVPAIIAHPLALQVNKVSIFIYSIAFSTILSIEAVPTNEYAATLPSVTASDGIMSDVVKPRRA